MLRVRTGALSLAAAGAATLTLASSPARRAPTSSGSPLTVRSHHLQRCGREATVPHGHGRLGEHDHALRRSDGRRRHRRAGHQPQHRAPGHRVRDASARLKADRLGCAERRQPRPEVRRPPVRASLATPQPTGREPSSTTTHNRGRPNRYGADRTGTPAAALRMLRQPGYMSAPSSSSGSSMSMTTTCLVA